MARETRRLVVKQKQNLTPNMIRITLGGDALNGFPLNMESGYVKLVFAREASPVPLSPGKKFLTRSYTVRHHDAGKNELVLDFVNHGDNGPASAWGAKCVVGDEIDIAGPGPVKLVDIEADWFFLAGDMTALPALSVNLEKLPADARGHAVIEVVSESDIQSLDVPPGMELHWIVNPHPDQENTILADAVRECPWLPGRPNVWVASEFSAMRAIKTWFLQEKGVGKTDIYASSYWKIGTTDEGNKKAKAKLAEEEAV